MNRVSIKVTGAQGQGVNSVGELLGKGLKRDGYCVFGYREYMSVIKGGHSSYQLDISDTDIRSTETKVDILICFNHHGLEKNWDDVKAGGIILHQTPDWKFPETVSGALSERKIQIIELPSEKILKENKFPPIMGNMLITAAVWEFLGQQNGALRDMAKEQFEHKGDKVLKMNYECIDKGMAFAEQSAPGVRVALPAPADAWKKCMLITGSRAMGLGAIHAGCRMYVGYPMTPSSPLLSYMADIENRTGIVLKQAEDEITAAQMMSGAMFMGTRAMTATSGGGFDLMTETLSLLGIIESPGVIGLGMRPGPATGLPTWTAQGDLMLAVHSAHGEFARCVISVSDSQDSFDLMPIVFNIAEEYQIPVIFLFDKQIAEAIYTQPLYDQEKATLDRGTRLVTDPKKLKTLKATDRYDTTVADGVSQRWLPGTEAATFVAQGDEHNEEGSVDEGADNAKRQMDKRMRKLQSLKEVLPEPVLYGDQKPDTLLVGWGSTKGPVLDALEILKLQNPKVKVGYLHYTYVWPLKTELLVQLSQKAKRTVLIEGNFQGQLGLLIAQESGLQITDRILKYDGRPFFTDETADLISPYLR